MPAASAPAPAQPDAAKEARSGGEVSHPSTQAAPPSAAKVPVAPAGTAARVEAGGAAPQRSRAAPQRGARAAPAQVSARETQPPGRVIASPAARKRARERGVDLGGVDGSGPRGRVVLADIERAPSRPERPERPTAAAPAGAAARGPSGTRAAAPAGRRRRALPPRAELRDETLPLSPMRKAIARNLAASKPGAPHFYLETSVGRAPARRAPRAARGARARHVSVNDLVVKAAAEALSRHPEVNAAWGADAIVRRGAVDVGVAVALDDGLVTPVVRDADQKDVFEIAAEIRDLAGRARAREAPRPRSTRAPPSPSRTWGCSGSRRSTR